MRILLIICCVGLMVGCSVSKTPFSPTQKYSPETLERDFGIFEHTLEEAHPGLYWYNTKDSMDGYFNWGREKIKDSLTEPEFRRVLSFIISKIKCGHTSLRASKAYSRYADTVRISRIFPLSLKIWRDTAIITANLHRKDSILLRGTIITGINGRPMPSIIDSLFNFISTDGYNTTYKYQALSNRGFFGSLYTSVFGFPNTFDVQYIDSVGQSQHATLLPYYPAADTFSRAARVQPPQRPTPQPTRRERRNIRRNGVRLLKVDSTTHVAMMHLSYFGRGFGLKPFFRRSFRALKQNDINHLIIDVRANTGGSPSNSTQLTRYITKHDFKIGDSLYAIVKHKEYGKYIQGDYLNRLFMTVFTRKRKDGYYHLGYFERHVFKPKKKNHFDGKVYILIGGNSFSATTLFASTLDGQDNVTLIGEETGGGAYGNSAWQIPYLTLPETRLRISLPLYRLVINKDYPKTGRGVMPEVETSPTYDAVTNRVDQPLRKAIELIDKDKKK